MPHSLCHALLLVALAAGQAWAADNRTRPMDATHTLTQTIGALPDAALLQRDEAAVAALPGQAALAGFQGVLIGAPRRVDARAGQALTALVLSGRSASRSRQLPWRDNAVLLAADVDRGQVFAGPAFVRDPSKAPPDQPVGARPAEAATEAPAPSSDGPPEATSAGSAWLDVAGTLGLPRQTMRLALRLVYHDQVSNTVLVEQAGDGPEAGATPMAEVQAVFARLAEAGQSAHRLPLYVRNPATPSAPTGPGLAFVLGRIAPPGAALPLHAALRIELSRPMMIDPARVQGPAPAAFTRNGPPRALVRASVLLLRRNRNEPYLIPVEFPLWSERELRAGDLVDAAFSVDLAALLPAAALEPGAQVYLLAGRHLAGPVALQR